MYNYRHYPVWGQEVMWFGDPILDESKNIKGIGFVCALIEDTGWHGLVKAGYLTINPLKLRYPDNTMTGTDYATPVERFTIEDFHSAINAGFNPDLFTYYRNAVQQAAELLGLEPEWNNNYWLSGASYTSVYQDNETAQECLDRIAEEQPALNFLRLVIAEDDFSSGIRNGFLQAVSEDEDEDLEDVEFIDMPFKNDMKKSLTDEMIKLKQAWGTDLIIHSQRVCEHGLVHLCKQNDEETPQRRGEITIKQEYLPIASRWQTTERVISHQNQQIQVNPKSVENYKTLVKSFDGSDGYSLRPYLSNTGEIVLDWRLGPYQSGQAIIGHDNTMKIRFVDKTEMSSSPLENSSPKELEMTLVFDPDKLSEIIAKGITQL